MKMQRLAIALTVVNLALTAFLLAQFGRASADVTPPVLRGRALEIVDARGRIRASLTVEEPVTMNSKAYPETVVFRLSDPKNGPVVKLTASENGSALGLSDDADGGVQIHARSTGSFVRVVDKNQREQTLKP